MTQDKQVYQRPKVYMITVARIWNRFPKFGWNMRKLRMEKYKTKKFGIRFCPKFLRLKTFWFNVVDDLTQVISV